MSSRFRIRFSSSPRAVLRGGEPVPEYVHEEDGACPEDGLSPRSYRRGYEDGIKEWGNRFGSLLEELRAQLAAVDAFRKELVSRLEDNIVDLALAVSQKLMHQEIAEGSHKAGKIVRGLLRSLDLSGDAGGVRVRLHPADHEDILRTMESDTQRMPELGKIAFTPDESIGRGSFQIDSEYGQVIYNVEAQLRELRGFLEQGESV